jgi:hypothetical protein
VRAEAARAGHRVELGVVELPGEAGEGEGLGADESGEVGDGGAAFELPAVVVEKLLLRRGFEEGDLLEVGGAPLDGPAFAGAGELLPGGRQVEQPAAARDPGEGLAELGGDGLDAPVLVDEVGDAGGFVEGVEALAVEVFGDGQDAGLVVVEVADGGGDVEEAGGPGAAEAALAEDQLVAAAGHGPDEDGLEDAVLGDAGGERLVLGIGALREGTAVPGVGVDGGDG